MASKYLKVDENLSWLMDEASSATIQRGQSYYLNNRVGPIQFDQNAYTGSVMGTDLYRFKIDTFDEVAMCQCPADYPCKHLIAAIYAISSKKNIVDRYHKTIKKAGSPPSELVALIDKDLNCRLMRRHPETGKLEQILYPNEMLKLPNGNVVSPLSLGKMNIFHVYFEHRLLENIAYYNDLPRYFSNGIPMHFCGVLPLKLRIKEAEPVYKNTDKNDLSAFHKNLLQTSPESIKITEPRYYIEFYYEHPLDQKEIIYKEESSYRDPLESPLLVPVYNQVENQPANPEEKTERPGKDKPLKPIRYDYYWIKPEHNKARIWIYYQWNMIPLTKEGLINAKDNLISSGVQNLKKYLPKVFSKGPVPLLSLYPKEGKKLKIQGRWEFLYTFQRSILDNEERFNRALSGKNSEKYFARFEIVINQKRGASLKSIQKGDNGNYAQISTAKELYILERLQESIFFTGRKGGKSFSKSDIARFVQEGAAELKSYGVNIQIHKSLAKLMSSDANIRLSFQMNSETSGIDWFDGHIEAGGMSVAELRKALAAYRKKEEHIQLRDGQWVSLEMIGLNKLMDSFEKLGVKVRNDGAVTKMSRGEALALSLELESEARTEKAIENLRTKIRELPLKRKTEMKHFASTFQGTLRDYQKEGISFLMSLHETGIGGILADDMGLGKTIQGLAFLARLKSEKEKTGKDMIALIVGPLASISVWKKECEKHFPELTITLWHGSERVKSELPAKGIILTTYGTLLRDFSGWKNRYHFDTAILDEAQNLKNFRSLSSHAVRQTSADTYFCLTGTPLENHLADLWSLFDILFPGYLGTRKSFLKNYQNSIGTSSLQYLRKKIEPFVLRRTKGEVLKELPPLTETLVPVTMTEKQRKFYDEARKLAIMELATAKENYLMVMLPHLTRLRRIACHPEAGNPLEAQISNSGKFQYLKESLPELQETSAGVLIFSQYTDILKICARLLDELNFSYFYLDGQTPIKKRETMVERFQNGENSFFLISLKAGGTALTLHRADTIIHLDPWWNPATERQASDRAHRMGQKKNVFVYKLYSEQSIEEKVLELQKKKKEIFDSLFGEGIETSGKISKEQLMKLISE